MIISGKNLRTALRAADITQDEAAKRLGVARQTLINYLKTGELSPQIVQNVQQFLGIDLQKDISDKTNSPVMSVINNTPGAHYGSKKNGVEIPMYGSAATASEVEVYSDISQDEPTFSVNIPQFRDCAFGKMVYGHSMYPTIESGAYVFCKTVMDKSFIIPGEVYFIEADNFAFIKRLLLGEKPGEYIAVSDNDETRRDGDRKYQPFPISIDKIRQIFLVKGTFKQNQN